MSPAPEFIIAGSAKSGTTALHFMLDQHPDVFMSPIKETNFFIHGYESTRHFIGLRGERVLEGQDESDIVDTHDKYANLFTNAPQGAIRGEASPWYLINSEVPARILAHRPNTKIVIILRDPADVAFANFVHLVRDRAESLRLGQIDRVFDESRYAAQDLYPFCDHLSLPKYGRHLPVWLSTFDPANVHLMIYEEFKADRRGQLSRLFEFLGLSDEVSVDVERRVNVSGMPRSEALQSFLQGGKLFKKLIGMVVPKKPRRKVRAMIEAMNTGKRVGMDATTRARFDEVYRDDVAYVESLLGRELDVWRQT
ncbi:MAG: sulfotransferase [Gammaproteobacteria bacterium]